MLNLPSCLIQLLERWLPTSSGALNKTLDQLFLCYSITSSLSITRFDGRVKHGLAVCVCVFVNWPKKPLAAKAVSLQVCLAQVPQTLGKWQRSWGAAEAEGPAVGCMDVGVERPPFPVSTVWGPQRHCHSQN